MDKPDATIEQITAITDQLINLMDSHLFTENDAAYLSNILRSLYAMTIEALKVTKND